ncbi:hypothetical protein ACQEV2_20500 [Streptomyces sp. CA-251387]|uniref:hypothetical protein n=1 Tax=Streptomyces sp. CA-251387 TaxID=3240064 RepID=UPI003D8C6333
MTASSTPSHVPSVALRGRQGALWLEDGSLTLEQDGIRRRIPLTAVEEVRPAPGVSPRGVEVVLTAPEGTRPTVYRVAHRGASARDVFVATVTAALPARDAEERRRDGAEQVVVLPGTVTPPWHRKVFEDLTLALVLGVPIVGWIAGLVTLIMHADIIGAILWFFGTKPLIIGVVLYGMAAKTLYDRAILRRRGVTVLAGFHRHDGKKRMFQFTDLDGVPRDCEVDSAAEPVSTSPERFQVTYDPRKPERVAARLPVRTWVWRTLGVGVFGTLFLYAGLYMVPYQLIQVLS